MAYLGDVAGTGSFSPLGCGADRPGGGRHRQRFFGISSNSTRPSLATSSGTGNTNSSDVTLMNRLLAGIATPQIPQPPAGLTIPATGPDPTLSLPPAVTATAGGTVTVPVNIDTARPAGSSGLMEATLALRYNPQLFSVTAADIKLGTVPSAGSGWQLGVAINPETGEIGITLFSTTPIQSTAGGSLVTITLQGDSGTWQCQWASRRLALWTKSIRPVCASTKRAWPIAKEHWQSHGYKPWLRWSYSLQPAAASRAANGRRPRNSGVTSAAANAGKSSTWPTAKPTRPSCSLSSN